MIAYAKKRGVPATAGETILNLSGDQLTAISGRYPFVMKAAERFHVDELEFLDRSHPTYVLRPKLPLEVTFSFYSPSITFCYPGGEGPLNTPPHGL